MKLNDLIGNDFPEIAAQLSPQAGDVEIAAITADSRQVVPGSLFVALAGTKADGAGFVSDAIARGACAVIAAPGVSPSSAVPVLQAANPRRVLALAAARFYGRQPQTMVAVTGTAGKTSVASFVRQIWAHSRPCGRNDRHDRRHCPGPQRLRLADHARSRVAAPASCRTRRRRRHPCGDGGIQPWPRPEPARRRAPCGCRFHQSRPRSHGLSSDRRGLHGRQDAAVRRRASQGVAGGHLCR